MTGEAFFLPIGAALILAALLARTWLLRVIGLTPARTTFRLTVGVVGVLCVLTGLILIGSDRAATREGRVKVTIVQDLNPRMVREEIRVFLDGRPVGVVKVDERSPVARLIVIVPKVDRYDYRLESARQRKGEAPSRAVFGSRVRIDGNEPLLIYYSERDELFLTPPLE